MHHAQAPGFYSKWNKEPLAGSKQKHHVTLNKLFSDCCVEGGCRGAKGKETIWEATLMARRARGRLDGTGGKGDREQGTRVLFGRSNQQGLLTSWLGGLRRQEDLGGSQLQDRGTP